MNGPMRLSVISAALVTQFFILAIICAGAIILRIGQPRFSRYHERPGLTTSSFAWIAIVLALVSMGALLLSNEYVETYRPLFGELSFPSLVSSNAFLVMFIADIAALTFLIGLTGGSRASAFSPLLLSVPTFAIFLREPLGRIVVYSSLITIVFTFQMVSFAHVYKEEFQDRRESQRADGLAFWTVSFATLVLTTAIGYATRPQ